MSSFYGKLGIRLPCTGEWNKNLCLIYNKTVAVMKVYIIKKHNVTKDSNCMKNSKEKSEKTVITKI